MLSDYLIITFIISVVVSPIVVNEWSTTHYSPILLALVSLIMPWHPQPRSNNKLTHHHHHHPGAGTPTAITLQSISSNHTYTHTTPPHHTKSIYKKTKTKKNPTSSFPFFFFRSSSCFGFSRGNSKNSGRRRTPLHTAAHCTPTEGKRVFEKLKTKNHHGQSTKKTQNTNTACACISKSNLKKGTSIWIVKSESRPSMPFFIPRRLVYVPFICYGAFARYFSNGV